MTLLKVDNLSVDFNTRLGKARVLNRVSLSLGKGETLGLVGESGCGKSMTSLSIMGLLPKPNGKVSEGEISFEGNDLLSMRESELRRLRGNDISMIFQEPMSSLNPVFSVGFQIAETIKLHQKKTKREAYELAEDLLNQVGIPDPKRHIHSYPHQLSGGMRQRVMIAMALSCQPRVLIADEPTTALDVTVQSQIFDLIQQKQDSMNMGIILITHDIGVIAEMADRVAVMYAGSVVEEGLVQDILDNPQHPYTEGLIGCVPVLREDIPDNIEMLKEIEGVVPSMYNIPRGCAFADRCSWCREDCRSAKPLAHAINTSHNVYCYAVSSGDKT